jgi:hypothetical protein
MVGPQARLLFTTDGGQTWIRTSSGAICDLFFLRAFLHGWASGNGSVNYYTTDGVSIGPGVFARAVPPWVPSGSDLLNGWSVSFRRDVFDH